MLLRCPDLWLVPLPSAAAVLPPPVTDSSSTGMSNPGPAPIQQQASASSLTTTHAGTEPAQPRLPKEGKRCEQVGPTRFEEEDGFGAA